MWVVLITTVIALIAQLYGLFVPFNFSKFKVIRTILLLLWAAILASSVFGFIMFNYCESISCAETLTTIGGSLVIGAIILNILMAGYGIYKQT